MNNQLIYFLKKLEVLIMAFKKRYLILLILIFNFNKFSYSEILYDKNGIIISNIDIEIYKNFYKNTYNKEINSKKSTKEIILIKKLIQKLENKNPSLLKKIDEQINASLKKNNTYNENLRDYDRFLIIKNELINEYYQNNFSLDELKLILSEIADMNIALSTNNCLTIEKIINSKAIKELPLLVYKKIKENTDLISINIDKRNYQICFDENFYNILQRLMTEFIEIQIQKDLKEMLYG